MSETNDQDTGKGRLSLRPAGRLELGRTVDAGSVRQSFSHGRSKVVQVEVRKKRAPIGTPGAPAGGTGATGTSAPTARAGGAPAERPAPTAVPRALTATEQAARRNARDFSPVPERGSGFSIHFRRQSLVACSVVTMWCISRSHRVDWVNGLPSRRIV